MNVLILCDKFLPVSEQFIYNQIKCLDVHNLFLFARKRISTKQHVIAFQNELIWYDKPLQRLRYKFHKTSEQHPAYIQCLFQKFIAVNKIDLVYVHYGTTATAYLETLQEIRIPVICAFHGFDASRKLNNQSYREAIISLGKSAFRFTVPSAYLAKKLEEIGVPVDKITKIPYGADIEKIDRISGSSADSEDDKITIIHAGRLVAKKGVPDLVKVFLRITKKHSDLRLKIVGGGDQEGEVRSIINASNYHQKIEMTGPLSHQELIAAVKSADIFVLNSRETERGETEGMPNSIMEAMACHTCVVSTRHSGIPELLTDNVNALMVDPKQNDQLEQALKALIQDSQLRDRLQKSARKTVDQGFSLTRMKKTINTLVTSADT
ncbi:MAG: glycosyltransferase family 4 protein [Bacteroidota bacterium]